MASRAAPGCSEYAQLQNAVSIPSSGGAGALIARKAVESGTRKGSWTRGGGKMGAERTRKIRVETKHGKARKSLDSVKLKPVKNLNNRLPVVGQCFSRGCCCRASEGETGMVKRRS